MDGVALERPMAAASVVAVSFMIVFEYCLFVFSVMYCLCCFLIWKESRGREVKIAECYV